MKLSNKVLVQISVEYRYKSDKQLNYLLDLYKDQLSKLRESDRERLGEVLGDKIKLIEQELQHRDTSKTQTC